MRYETIEIITAQTEGTIIFSGIDVGESGHGTWEDGEIEEDREIRTLEAVCVQHEIDHLNGMRILDRVVDTTIRVEKKIGRNNLVTIKRGDAVKVLKYKNAQKFLNDGWIIDG